jgi:hypothetical protein
LQLERIMHWRSVLDGQGKEGGLYKVRGETLQALVAGIWTFHVRVFSSFLNVR